MKLFTAILIFALSTFTLRAQKFSPQIDSLTKASLGKLTPTQKQTVNRILKNRKAVNFLERIDTAKYDYAFIEEHFALADTAVTVTERYFLEAGRRTLDYGPGSKHIEGTLPALYFYNGIRHGAEETYFASSVSGVVYFDMIDYYYTLDTLRRNYAALQPVQELSYDNTQFAAMTEDTSAARKTDIEDAAVKRLKNTYQVITIVDKIKNKVTVSVQLPAKNPEVTIGFVKMTYHSW